MQLCTATQAYTHYPTATQCREFALLIGPPFEGVTVQINDGVINASSTGACIYNSGGSGKFQLLSTTTIGNICDVTVGGGLCACIPEHEYARCSSHPTESHSSTHTHTHTLETDWKWKPADTNRYITVDGSSLSGNDPIHLGVDTFQYFGHEANGEAYTPALCCQLCSQTRNPAAPPSPPQLPTSPATPPLPPGVPPPPPYPWYPPPETQVLNAASAASSGFSFSAECSAVVITDDGCRTERLNPLRNQNCSTYIFLLLLSRTLAGSATYSTEICSDATRTTTPRARARIPAAATSKAATSTSFRRHLRRRTCPRGRRAGRSRRTATRSSWTSTRSTRRRSPLPTSTPPLNAVASAPSTSLGYVRVLSLSAARAFASSTRMESPQALDR